MAHKRSRLSFEADLSKQQSPFVIYGTPLPPLDEHARDDGSYVPAWKQEVTDAQGRKRLHGAFTGGFSAGYYNTVGSKEGWAPATFVSSRTKRMKDNQNTSQQRPEDFMDDEDIREADESKHVATSDGFSGFGTADDPSRGDAMIDLFRPAEDSMGVKLLNKMGWKQGQGIGPRIRRKVDAEDPSSATHLFAPEDAPMISFVKKNDFKGIGYKSEASVSTAEVAPATMHGARGASDDSEEEAENRPGLSFTGRIQRSKPVRKGGLGVGILNDTGSDDDDPYSMGPRISYNKTLGGDKKIKKKNNTMSTGMANPLLKKKPVFVSKKLSSMRNVLRKCHDGRLPLAGFTLADELDTFSSMSLTDEKYKPPPVPDGWRPSKVSDKNDSAIVDHQSTSDLARASSHNNATRASALGETLLPGKSVFDYLSSSARDRLVKATGKSNLPQALGEALQGTAQSSNASPVANLPYLDSQTASQALTRATIGGFMPYAEDLPKRQRYKTFLEISAGTRDEQPSRPLNTSVEDYINELNEFVRAAEVFRPVGEGLGSRFTSSSATNLQSPSQPGTSINNADNLISRPPPKPEDPSEVAAKLGMFGPLTRTILTFAPTRLVARRFGVEYIGGSGGVTLSSSSTANTLPSTGNPSFDIHSSTDTSGKDPSHEEAQTQPPTQNPSSTLNQDIDMLLSSVAAEVKIPTIDIDTNEALEQERPGQAVFRAIFGSDDEDDDEDESS